MVYSRKDDSGEIWWCKSHKRQAEFILPRNDGRDGHCCDPSLGGILLPCDCQRITDDKQWREDAEKVIQALHKRVSALEGAVISQQKIMEAIATDKLSAPKTRIIRAS